MRRKAVFPLLMICAAVCASVYSQPGPGTQRPRTGGPVLIKDFEEPGEKAEKVYPHDPVAARKNLEIGEYYMKRKNYAAAVDRFSEAIEYDKTWPESYKKLIKAYDKKKEYMSAVEACLKFAENNPDSGQLKHFRKEEEKYRKKQEKLEKKEASRN